MSDEGIESGQAKPEPPVAAPVAGQAPALPRQPAAGAVDPTAQPEGRFGRPGPPLARSPFFLALAAGLGLLLTYSVYLAIRNAFSILILIFIALFLAVGLNPAVVRLQRLGLPRGAAVALVGLGTVLVFGGGLLALVPPLISQGNDLIGNLPSYLDSLQRNETIRQLNEDYDLVGRLESAATTDNIANALGGVWGGARLVLGTAFNLLTVLLLTIYFMAAFERITDGAYRLVPASRRQRVRLIGDEILAKVGAYMAGALAIALIAGLSTFAMLIIVGVAYPYALAVVVAITDLVPQVGATLGAVVVSLIGFATSIPVGITCVVFFIVYQQIENWAIYPMVMRRAVKVSDLAAIVAVLLGISLLGVVGALIAIPAVAALQLIVREVVLPRQELH